MVAYLACAWLCWQARRVALHVGDAGARQASSRLWGVLAAGLVALGINKQLDLQSAVTELGRAIVRKLGWHESRRVLQLGFVGLVVMLTVGLGTWIVLLARQAGRRVYLALIGWAGLCCFVALRAASIHHVDRDLGARVAGARLNVILELGGIILIAINALSYGRPAK